MMLEKIFSYYYEWWKNVDKFIFFIIFLLFSLGLFFSLVSTSIIASDKLNTNTYYFFFKHLIFIFLGIFVIISFSFIDQKTLIRISIILFSITLFTLVLIPFIGVLKRVFKMAGFTIFSKISTNWVSKAFFYNNDIYNLKFKKKTIYI